MINRVQSATPVLSGQQKTTATANRRLRFLLDPAATWAAQAVDALLTLKHAADAAIAAGQDGIELDVLAAGVASFRHAALVGSKTTPAKPLRSVRNWPLWPAGCGNASTTTYDSPTGRDTARSTTTLPNAKSAWSKSDALVQLTSGRPWIPETS
jgi:hypothetical protein